MKKNRKYLLGLIILLFLLPLVQVLSDELTQNLETRVLESFDDDSDRIWIAKGSKFTTTEKDANGNITAEYPQYTKVTAYPSALYGFDTENIEQKKAFGVRCKFDRRGYNYVEIMPVKVADSDVEGKDIVYTGSDGTNYVSDPIKIVGRVKLFDVWVWGANFKYFLDAHFEDSWGVSHALRLGNLNFIGWKNLSLELPNGISQSSNYIPKHKPLVFTKFVLWTQPSERVDEYYLYMDHIKVLTDVFETRFDGDELANPDFSNQIWESE